MSSIITRGMAQGNTAIFVTAHDTAPTTSKKVGRKPKNNAEVLTHACSSTTSTITTESTKRKLQNTLEVKAREEEVEVEEEEEEEQESDEYDDEDDEEEYVPAKKVKKADIKKAKKTAKKTETKERGKTAAKAQELQLAQIGSQLNTQFGNVQTMQLVHQVNSLVNSVGNAFVQMMPHFAAHSTFAPHFGYNNNFIPNTQPVLKLPGRSWTSTNVHFWNLRMSEIVYIYINIMKIYKRIYI
jgi:hypothetical protein